MTENEPMQKIEDIEEGIENKLDKDNSTTNSESKSRLVGLFSKLKKIFSKLNQKILDANGFLTKEGGYLCKAELHAVAIPASMISASYMLPKPLGILTFLSYLFMNKKGFDLLQSDYEGHWNDVMEEYAYAATSMAITIAYWTYLTQETIGGAGDINQILAKLVLGA